MYLPAANPAADHPSFRLANSIALEISALVILGYVLFRQGRALRDLGLSFTWTDVPSSFVITVFSYFGSGILYLFTAGILVAICGRTLQPKSLDGMFGFGITTLSVIFVVVNPVFEELIVRAYLMTEVAGLTGKSWLAVVISTGLQTSYHLYQGAANAVMVAGVFLLFSIYYAKKRRILPLLLAHFYLDAAALLLGRL